MLKSKILPVLLALMTISLISLIAGCEPTPYQLSTSITPNGGGTVNPSTGTFAGEVTLVATPAKYYKFNGWAGAVSGTTNPLTVKMTSDKQIVAQFTKITYNLQVQTDSPSNGTVKPNGGTFEAGTQVSVTATPTNGYSFDHWSGSTTGKSNPMNVFIDDNKSLTANFVKIWRISATSNPDTGGKVVNGSGTYDDGAKVTLTAEANFPFAFTNWGEVNTDKTNPTIITMNSDKFPVAHFIEQKPLPPQTKTGMLYNNSTPKPVIPLKEGQWVEVGIRVTPNSAVTILDSDLGLIQDLGLTSTQSYRFQAKKTGDYVVNIRPNSLTGTEYSVKYTVYSIP